MAPKRKSISSSSKQTELPQKVQKLAPATKFEFLVNHECPFISPKAIKVVFQMPNKISFADKVEIVFPNMSHGGFEGAKTFKRNDGGSFDTQPGITLKNVSAESEVIVGLNKIVDSIIYKVESIVETQDSHIDILYKPPYYETKNSDNQIQFRLFDKSPLYICHADATQTGLFSYLEAQKALSAAIFADPDTPAVFFEFDGRKHFYTTDMKHTLEAAMDKVVNREFPDYAEGMVFNDHLINARVSWRGFYLKPQSEEANETTYVMRLNMYLNQIRVIQTGDNDNGDNAKFGFRRLNLRAGAADLDLLM